MLYIHQLNQLTVKSAELESVYLIREIKQKTPYPLQEEQLQHYFADLFISETDKNVMEQALPLIQPNIGLMETMLEENNPLYETINLQRSIQILKELPTALMNNIIYADEITTWQNSGFLPEIASVLNAIPKLRTKEDKIVHNQRLNQPFQKILRNSEFGFHATDIVNESHVALITGLSESMAKGFILHFSIEEELKQASFNDIKRRLPAEKVAQVEAIQKDVETIKRGLERAYDANMRMVNKALILYAYVKWLNEGV